jgi:hypothetical protein
VFPATGSTQFYVVAPVESAEEGFMPCRRRAFAFAVAVSALFCALPALAASGTTKVVRVPKDARDIPSAIRLVKDGDAIELAAGTYRGSISIKNLGKAFTIRAAANATVILDGQGKPILRFQNGSRARGKRVTFERLTFQNGASITEGDGGAVTLTAAEARFVDCKFLNNTATGRTTGGGAVRVINGSDATFVRTEMRGNSSGNRGGAIEILFSTVAIEGGSFIENRTNPLNHKNTASGGAIYVLDGTLRVSDARFERNQAGWVGGAIYAYGKWTDPVDVPKSDLTIVRSTFLENAAVPNACCVAAGVTQGGAIHVENQTTLRLQNSEMLRNSARFGGAIDNYRGVVEITGSIFQWNQAVQAGVLGSGGAIFAVSNETGVDGTVNRRPALLTIADTLVQGGTGQPAASTGGCVTVGGDASRAYGENGAVPMGTVEENRARAEIRRSVLADCDVQRDAAGSGGFGGALQVSLASLLLEDSAVVESDARGDGAGGGGVSIQSESAAVITGSAFARNTADRWGAAIFLGGSTIQVAGSQFIGNDVRPGVRESMGDSRGAALYAIPQLLAQRPRNVGGSVTDSIFSENASVALWDVDPTSGPINEMRYDRNQFYETAFSDKVYVNSLAASSGASVTTLNRLLVDRGSRGVTDKSAADNTRLYTPPVAGALLAAPGWVGTGAPASAGSYLHYAWSGWSATLNGQPLPAHSGIAPAGPGTHTLVVDGKTVDTVTLAAATCANGAVCLTGGRFEVRVDRGRLLTRDADTAFFALPGGTRLAVQVLDRRDKNGHFWVLQSVSNVSAVSALSGHTLEITDTATGDVRTWSLPADENQTKLDRRAFLESP